ncbi:hypothetical protein ANN_11054 [Periplaneta americana]|uniref:Uncharacterized protein n=1 Tax=Periplaneta americana TaxID=6978 RepID=A0ABQ8T4N5_PERAM|nr:hypothetical protein ANN_11054 [Periplaneta americana]
MEDEKGNRRNAKEMEQERGKEEVGEEEEEKEGKEENYWLFNDAVPTTRLFSVDEIGDIEMVFGEMSPRIRHRLPGIHLTVGENLGKNPTRYPLKCVMFIERNAYHKSVLVLTRLKSNNIKIEGVISKGL